MTVMLAQPSKNIHADPKAAIDLLMQRDWTFELKWDGIRALIDVRGDDVTITNRNGRDITYRYPDVVETMQSLDTNRLYDCELVVLDGTGRPDFQLVATRDQVENSARIRMLAKTRPVHVIVFDILRRGDTDLRAAPWSDRRNELLLDRATHVTRGIEFNTVSEGGDTMWRFAVDMGLEGLMAKDPDSAWVPKRSDAWVKVKVSHAASFIVTGYEPGEGSAAGGVGALLLGLYDTGTGELVESGRVGTGFSWGQRQRLKAQLDGGKQIIVDVAFNGVTKSGKPRFPSYRGVRDDVLPRSCTTDQLRDA